MRTDIIRAIDDASDELIALARRIHATPEVAFHEVQASAWLTETLERHGFTVGRGIAELPTAFRAEIPGGRPGPAVAFLAEYDALPEIGHACGHNLICTAALGAGIGLAAVAAQVPGKVIVLGTPAEEGGGGKVLMLERGAFSGIDAAMLFHPADYTLTARSSLASWRLKVKFLGRASHAAAAPEKGINALDALIQMFVNIGLLRQQLREDVRVHGIITYGGAAPNIIPDRAEASFSVRAADGATAAETLERVLDCGRAAATATGARVEFDVKKGYEAMKPSRRLAAVFERQLAALEWPVDPLPERQRMGSTDMGDVSQVMPAIHPYLKIGDGMEGHTVEFRDAALSGRGFGAMLTAAKAMALTGLEILRDPVTLEEARAELRN